MNQSHLHLLLNHIPIYFSLIGFILLLIGILRKNGLVKQISLTMLIVAAISGFFGMESGEGAEEVLESLEKTVTISHHDIHEHEEAAETAIIFIYLTGLLSFIVLILDYLKKLVTKKLIWVVLISSILSSITISRVGYLGGLIRHSQEINVDESTLQNHEEGEEEKSNNPVDGD